MTQWLNERYISREEHQRIVEYYRNLVAQMHCKAKDLQMQLDELEEDYGVEYSEPRGESEGLVISCDDGSNVIRFNFRR
jgi:hypothetical protein